MLETVVIGAGIAGFSVAFSLWERGAAVTIVEASRPGSGATGASAGMLVAQYEAGEPGAKFRLCVESRRRYPEFAQRLQSVTGGGLHLRWDGMLVANLTEEVPNDVNSQHQDGALAYSGHRPGDWVRDEGAETDSDLVARLGEIPVDNPAFFL